MVFVSCVVKHRVFFTLSYDIGFWPEGESSDVFSAVFGDDQNVVFAVTAGTGLRFWLHNHGLYGDHHTRCEDSVDILT